MPGRERKNLFKRLTRLFRSGPVVKRKIRALDTAIAVPDKTRSSGTLLFQKSLSPTYATITSNAYNLSERLMRYQDFQEMEYSVHGATRIPQLDGTFKTIAELADECAADPTRTFVVYAYDHEKRRIVPALGKQARQTCVDHAWKITFDNGQTLTASPEHRLMLRDGSYCKVEDLKPGDAMMPFRRKDLFAGAKEGTKGYSWVYTMDDRFRGWTKEHQLVAEWVAGRELMDDEVVHHVNFVKTDNRPENLLIMSKSDHDSYHAAINNGAKWAPENGAWIESFKARHAAWMRDNAPTRRRDVTFPRIVQVGERVGFDIGRIAAALDVTTYLLHERLVANGFSTFSSFKQAYERGQHDALLDDERPGKLTRDLTLDLIKAVVVEDDTKRSASVKLGCTVNVLDKFLERRLNTTWNALRREMGFTPRKEHGGRPKGSTESGVTFQDVSSAYVQGLTRTRLAHKMGVSTAVIMRALGDAGHKRYSDFQRSYQNCKVVSIEYVGVLPLYDLTVDGYKNFATDSVISHNTPEIASALDIYADETCAQDDRGRVLHVYSDSEKIKEILEDLFYNTLNVEFNMRSWARNLVKYGDFFLYNDVSPEYGVVNAFPIPVNEIEREENYDREDPFAVRYRWVTLGNRTLENWEVTHFRLLGNDMFLPYGSSVIEPARRIWRQLILIEDAMLVYRVVRAPERRVFYIDVANVPPESVPLYVEEQRRNLRSSQVVDNQTGRVDLRYNPLPVHKDTPIPLLDGTTMTIETVAKRISDEPGWTPWTYSVQDGTGQIVPGKVVWCGKNYVAKKLVKVWLDDGGYVLTAPEHPYVMRDGTSRRADELRAGDSLMPLYRDKNNRGYERCYNPASQRYETTHTLVAKDVYADEWRSTNRPVVHHREPWLGAANKLNNHPQNLQVMDFWEHKKWHVEQIQHTLLRPDVRRANSARMATWNRSDDKRQRVSRANVARNSVEVMSFYNRSTLHASHNENRRWGQLRSWQADRGSRCEAMRWIIPGEFFDIGSEKLRADPSLNRDRFHAAMMADAGVVELLVAAQSSKRDVSRFSYASWIRQLKSNGVQGFTAYKRQALSDAGHRNHKVDSVEFVDVPGEDVYCMTIVGPNGEDDRHNFAVLSLDDQGRCTQSGVFTLNSVDEDYYIPVRGAETGTRIDTLAGGQNAAAVEDVAYIQKKLFAALKIPRAYLGYDEMLSSKATLAQEDIRFSRSVNVIQKTILAELNKLAIIHLYAHGYDDDDLQNFTLRLSNPSTVAQQQKLELWRAKFEIGGSVPEGMVDAGFVQREVWGLTAEQIDEINDGLLDDAKRRAEIETIAAGDDGTGGAGPAGGDDDLFGGAGGGEPVDDAGGGDDDLPPPETAGEEPEEDVEPGTELLTAADVPDDITLDLSLEDDDRPVRPKNQLDRALYNRGRRRTHGASKTHTPDFVKMTGNDNRSMKDPVDASWMRSVVSNPLGESAPRRGLPPDVRSVLRRMSGAFGVTSAGDGLIREGADPGVDVQEEIDARTGAVDPLPRQPLIDIALGDAE